MSIPQSRVLKRVAGVSLTLVTAALCLVTQTYRTVGGVVVEFRENKICKGRQGCEGSDGILHITCPANAFVCLPEPVCEGLSRDPGYWWCKDETDKTCTISKEYVPLQLKCEAYCDYPAGGKCACVWRESDVITNQINHCTNGDMGGQAADPVFVSPDDRRAGVLPDHSRAGNARCIALMELCDL